MSSRKKKAKSAAKEALNTSIYLLAIVVTALLLNSFVITRDVVSGDSMYDTLSDGDVIMLNLLSYRFSSPKRFDIIVFPSPDERGTYIVKRIIGLPNETVRIDEEGNIFVNERQLTDRYATEPATDPGLAGGHGITLANDEYFVLGDNRNSSMDSRSPQIRNVKKNKIKGKVFFRIMPFDSFGKVGGR